MVTIMREHGASGLAAPQVVYDNVEFFLVILHGNCRLASHSKYLQWKSQKNLLSQTGGCMGKE